ncbi:nucleoside phosphorylase [Enterococcus alishanensis]|uniref:nucleoside phosphorylase n=1 Tax=Enterococcus alishanensis TaxID=1303817 RepID=UPI001FE986EB|nr:nucleoside phosphorylase [Enterococcus alishanensis]
MTNIEKVEAHIQLGNSINVKKAIIAGDPARISKISKFLDNPSELKFNREFKSIVGYYHGEKILILSTGIGSPSTAIAIEELFNIGVRQIVRVGSCGSLSGNLHIGDVVVATGAVREDGLSKEYLPLSFPACPSHAFLESSFRISTKDIKYGIIRSHDGFYMKSNNQKEAFWSKYNVLASDMETSILYVIAAVRGIKSISILNTVVEFNESLEDGVNDLVNGNKKMLKGEKASIQLALQILTEGD